MASITRRTMLKTGFAASAGALTAGRALTAQGQPIADMSEFNSVLEPASLAAASASPRTRALLDFGWKFHLGHASDPALDFGFGEPSRESTFAKAAYVAPVGERDFDDSAWQEIDLPHDWALDLPFITSDENSAQGWKPIGRRFPATSVGWYRRRFDVPAESHGKRILLEFDGVYRDAIVLLNNHYLGREFSGYVPFTYDITDYLRYGEQNMLVVRADASLAEGWFYEGPGIYRHVWLTTTDSLHLAHWGTTVVSKPEGTGASVSVSNEVANESDKPRTCRVVVRLIDPSGKEAAVLRSAPQTVEAWGKVTFRSDTTLSAARLWSCEEPHLYNANCSLESDGVTTDLRETTFGIRSIHFDANTGFLLNGKPVKLKGTCNHQDHAGVGAAVPDRLQEERIALLVGMGSNAYRTTHNPATTELLDACDRAGMLVMSETRMMASTPEGLDQLDRMIRRDRNHPSIVLWSLANEEPDQGSERGAMIVSVMKRRAAELDPTRPVTAAMNGGWGRGLSHVVDVQGFNYAGAGGGGGDGTAAHIDAFHKAFPNLPTVGTETASVTTTRGIYADDPKRGYANAYGLNYPGYTLPTPQWWSIYADRKFLSGAFAWTGLDYRGEPSPYSSVSVSAQMGAMDTCGFPKDSYYYYKAWWGTEPVLHLFPHWNWAGQEGKPIAVWCYSNLEEIELLVNGKRVDVQKMKPNGYVQWQVPYAPGSIEARGLRQGKVVLTERRETTGAAASLRLTATYPSLRADREDMTSVRVEALDSKGRPVPFADHSIEFALAGPGRILGVGNGDPSSRESDRPLTPRRARRFLFNGLAMVFVQALDQPGALQLQASSTGIAPSEISIPLQAASHRLAVPASALKLKPAGG